MPIVYSTISEQTDHIHDVVVHQLCQKLLFDLNILTDLKDKIYIDTGYSAPQKTSDDDNNSILRQNKLIVKSTPNVNPNSLKWDSLNGKHTTGQMIQGRHIFRQFPILLADKASDIYLHEMTVPSGVDLEFELELVSRDQAYEVPSQLFRMYATGQVFSEILSYDYPIPADILTMIFSLYKMRRLTNPLSFVDYIKICSNDLIQYNVSRKLKDGNVELVIPKTNINVIASMDYSDNKPDEIKVNRSANAYQIKFTLNAQYERADMVLLRYPCVVNNQLVPSNMIVAKPSTTILSSLPIKANITSEQESIHALSSLVDKTACVKLPYYDDWTMVPSLATLRSYRNFLTAIFLIEEDPDNSTLIDLSGKLGEEDELHPIVKEILSVQGTDSFYTGAIFHLAVYYGDKHLDPGTLSFSSDLKLSVGCNKIDYTHRIVLSEITNIKYLDEKWLQYLYKYKDFFLVYPSVINYINNNFLNDNGSGYEYPAGKNPGATDDSHRPKRIIQSDIIAKCQKY